MMKRNSEQWFINILAFLLLMGLYFIFTDIAKAKLLYEEDFEYLDATHVFGHNYAYPYPMDWDRNMQNYHGYCYRTEAGATFNNFALVDDEVFSGQRAFKVHVNTNYPSSASTNCPHKWLQLENKARNELAPGHTYSSSQTAPSWGHVGWNDQAYWYSYAFRIPKDQAGLSTWINKATPRGIVTQFLGSQNSATPEVHFMIGGNSGTPLYSVEVTNSTAASGENNTHSYYKFNASLDEWHTLTVLRKRSWDTDGILKIYLDCHKTEVGDCQAIIDHHGGNAIRNKPVSIFKFGDYRSDANSGVNQIIEYDLFTVHDSNSDLDDVLKVYRDAYNEVPTVKPEAPELPVMTAAYPEDGKIRIDWTHPTKRTDGSDLPLTEIYSTTVGYTCNGKTGATYIEAPANTFYGGLPVTEVCSYTLTTVDTSGVSSATTAGYTYDPDNPLNPPIEIPEKPLPPEWGDDMATDETTLTLTWDHPIARVDGDSLTLDEIASTQVYWNCEGKEGSKQVLAPDNFTQVNKPTDETCVYTLTTTDVYDLTSAVSESYTYEVGGRFPIEDVDTTNFQAWIMVFTFLTVIMLVGIFALILRVYRKYFDDLPPKEDETVEGGE